MPTSREAASSPFHGSLAAPTNTMKNKKNLWDQGKWIITSSHIISPKENLKKLQTIFTVDRSEMFYSKENMK